MCLNALLLKVHSRPCYRKSASCRGKWVASGALLEPGPEPLALAVLAIGGQSRRGDLPWTTKNGWG